MEYCEACDGGLCIVHNPPALHIENEQERENPKLIKKSKARKQRDRITKAQRRRVFEKYSYECLICKCKLTEANWSIDHIKEIQDGGSNKFSNLAAMCRSCNYKKSKYRGKRYNITRIMLEIRKELGFYGKFLSK